MLSVVEIYGPLGAGPQLWGSALFGPHTQVTSAEFRVEGDRLVQRLHLAEVDEGTRVRPMVSGSGRTL